MRLSVIVITLNEAGRIRACLESVRWADEIVVLDGGSEDNTLAICGEYTTKVFVERDWRGFGVQKSRVLARAQGEWVLSIDSDERVSPELRLEIEDVLNNGSARSVYEIPRLSHYCGKAMYHGGWWPDPVARLFRRHAACFSDDLVHERLLFEGRPGRLTNALQHFPFETLEQVLDKANQYSTAGAEQLFARGRRGGLGRALWHGFWALLRTWVLQAGFLDGREGLMLALSNAQGTYYKYLKLHYLAKRQLN